MLRMYNMEKIIVFYLNVLCFLCFFVHASDRCILVHNTIKEIDECKGKLNLKLVRIWGGSEEDEENKFFETPTCTAIDVNQLIYICDMHNHCIKVFNNNGKYVSTIGRKGKGPGDLLTPFYITFTSDGDLLVSEKGGLRLQWFNSQGKSKNILNHLNIIDWIGAISKNEIAVYSHFRTFMKRRLLSVIDNNGKIIRNIGKYHDKTKNLISSERFYFSIDKNVNIYAANQGTPVIRKYSPDGRLLMVITFETPFEIPVKITINSSGDDIERKEKIDNKEVVKIRGNLSEVNIRYNKKNMIWQYGICMGMGIDSQNRIYTVKRRRLVTEKENHATAIMGGNLYIDRRRLNYDIVEKNDFNHILVFDSNGKIVAESQMTTLCDDIYICDNRLFVIDGLCNQRILEYEMIFDE